MTRKWKRLMAVGCSHGILADRAAIEAVIKFKANWKPHKTIHLGDFVDTTAFRSGARGNSDEASPVAPDIEAGLRFLKALHPNLVFCGNHEARLWRAAGHYNAIVAACGQQIVDAIAATCNRMNAELVEYNGVWQQRTLGNYKFMHGAFFNENAARDHAEAYGNVVFAHTHRAAMAKGRRDDCPTGFCVGTLADIPCMDYANTRRATLGWSQGFVWGEYCDDEAVLWLHEQPKGTQWRLPV